MTTKLKRDNTTPSLFIEGYLTDCFAAGERPVYGFPKNHLPDTSEGDLEAVTGFLATCDSTKN